MNKTCRELSKWGYLHCVRILSKNSLISIFDDVIANQEYGKMLPGEQPIKFQNQPSETPYFAWLYNNMVLLTNCEVHTAKYLDHSFKYGPNEMRAVRKAKVRIFSVWNEQFISESFII